MHTPQWSVLATALSLSLALGCSQGLAPTDEPHDGGILNHLGDAPFGGTIQLDSGTGGLNPGGGGGLGGTDAGTGGTTSGTGICGTDAATGDATLDACLDASCCTSFTACYADTACGACLADPSGTACSSNSKFLAFDTCWANNCDSAGGGTDGGVSPTSGLCGTTESTGDTTLDACLASNCCTSFSPCYSDTSCQACMFGSGTSCTTNSKYVAFDTCWTNNCDTASTPTGNGVCDSGESTGDTTVDACLSASCCSEFDACYASATCMDCMYDSTGTGCSSNSTYLAFDDCWYYSCG